MPCWMTQISLGLTFILTTHSLLSPCYNELTYRPNSVLISRVPCWGTMRKSPSLLYMARLDMDLLQVNTCTAIPCLVLLSPAPAVTKTTFSQLSTSLSSVKRSEIRSETLSLTDLRLSSARQPSPPARSPGGRKVSISSGLGLEDAPSTGW